MAKRKRKRKQYQKRIGSQRRTVALMIEPKLAEMIRQMADDDGISVSRLLAEWLSASLLRR